jgi:hypothetical protein
VCVRSWLGLTAYSNLMISQHPFTMPGVNKFQER